ncbi:MAG: hypothetical protein L6R28_22540 [Planctomycetes bacterium]|nr:hypothetical protein [Planctomycetota bacterium]
MARITRMTKRRLGELLLAEGLLTEEQVKAALAEQRKNNLFLGEALCKLGYVTADAIAQTIAQQFGLPYISAEQYKVGPEMVDVFPKTMLLEYQFLPIDKIGSTLIIIGAGLMNHDVLDELERISNCKVCQYVGTWREIHDAIEKLFKDHKPKDEEQLSDLGNMLLSSDDLTGVTAGAATGATMDGEASDLGQAVAAVTNTTSPVLQEALAALEGAKKPAADAKKLDNKKSQKPKSSLSNLSSSKLSAFAGKKQAGESGEAEATEEDKAPAGESGAAKKVAGSGAPKGGLLGFLKK